jgi:hypothetical protein
MSSGSDKILKLDFDHPPSRASSIQINFHYLKNKRKKYFLYIALGAKWKMGVRVQKHFHVSTSLEFVEVAIFFYNIWFDIMLALELKLM